MGLTERTEVEEAVKAVLKQFRVDVLQVQILQHIHELPMRAYRGRLSGVRRGLTFTLISSREETVIAKAMSQLRRVGPLAHPRLAGSDLAGKRCAPAPRRTEGGNGWSVCWQSQTSDSSTHG